MDVDRQAEVMSGFDQRSDESVLDEIDRQKLAAAKAAAQMVEEGMVVGLGTGSTAEFAISVLGDRVAAGLRIVGVPTSRRSAALARSCNVPLTDLQSSSHVDLTIDGADEIDHRTLAVLKGRGGALVREKLVAIASNCVVAIVDSTKPVERLGSVHPVPVEVLSFGWHVPAAKLSSLGGHPTLRTVSAGAAPFVSDNGNFILDVEFGPIDDPERLAASIKAITGVVDHGLFIGIVDHAIVGTDTGVDHMTSSS